MKSLVKLSAESLLKLASENSPLCFRLKNAVNTQSNTIAVVCDLDEVEMLLKVAKELLPRRSTANRTSDQTRSVIRIVYEGRSPDQSSYPALISARKKKSSEKDSIDHEC